QLDSMVRVQAGRLRVKLAEYYNSDGAEDLIVVELPRGTYVLSFHRRAPGQTKPHASNGSESHWESRAPRHTVRNWIIATVSLGVLLATSTMVILSLVSNRNAAQAARDVDNVPGAFRVFWNGFISGQDEPWVIFSNAKFVGRPEIALRYYNAEKDRNN